MEENRNHAGEDHAPQGDEVKVDADEVESLSLVNQIHALISAGAARPADSQGSAIALLVDEVGELARLTLDAGRVANDENLAREIFFKQRHKAISLHRREDVVVKLGNDDQSDKVSNDAQRVARHQNDKHVGNLDRQRDHVH